MPYAAYMLAYRALGSRAKVYVRSECSQTDQDCYDEVS
jgi:hypothetical protein